MRPSRSLLNPDSPHSRRPFQEDDWAWTNDPRWAGDLGFPPADAFVVQNSANVEYGANSVRANWHTTLVDTQTVFRAPPRPAGDSAAPPLATSLAAPSGAGADQHRPILRTTFETYREPDTFVGEPLIFWAARLMFQCYAEEAAATPVVQRQPRLRNGYAAEWQQLAQLPVRHWFVWPDDIYERHGWWRPGQHSLAFNINPTELGERLAEVFSVPENTSPESDARELESIRILFEYIPPSMLLPWEPGFHQPIHPELLRIAGGTPSESIPRTVVVAPPLALFVAPWINHLDPYVVKVTRAGGMPRRMDRLGFARWTGAPPEILEAIAPSLRTWLEFKSNLLAPSVRRLLALSALPNMTQETYGIAIGNPQQGYVGFEMHPRSENASLLDFIAVSAPPIDEPYVLIVAEGIFLEIDGDGSKNGPGLKVAIEKTQDGLKKIVGFFAARGDEVGLARTFDRLENLSFDDQVHELKQILLELGESGLDVHSVLSSAFHPANSDRDRAARYVGSLRDALLRRFAHVRDVPVESPHLAESPAFKAVYFNRRNVRQFLADHENIADRSTDGIDALMDYLSEDLMIFG